MFYNMLNMHKNFILNMFEIWTKFKLIKMNYVFLIIIISGRSLVHLEV